MGTLRRGVMVKKPVSIGHLRLKNEFDTHLALNACGLVLHLSFA